MASIVSTMKETEIESASQALAAAFMKDPLQAYVFPDEEERRQKSPGHFGAVLRYGHLFGEVNVLSNLAGAVVWLTPGNTDISPENAEKGGLAQLPQILGEEPTHRFFSVMDFLDPYHKQDCPQPHWYTMVIGINPSSAGQGYGKMLMEPVLAKAAAGNIPVYLETAAPANIPFYTKLGFRVVRELVEPGSQLPLWTFIKDQ